MTEAGSIGVLGAGTMGAGIAQVAAEAGLEVLLHDPVEGATERAAERIGAFLDRKVEKGQLSAADADAAKRRIGSVPSLEDLARADVVIEAAPEDLALKRRAFAALDAAAEPAAILATNTSSLSVADIASATSRQERVAGMHFFNPVPLMRLVEVIGGPSTDPSVTDALARLATRLGKTPVLAADTPGFIVNRIQRALYLEAFRIFEAGEASVPEIDEAIRGAGFRLGPFELADVVGTDVNLAAGESIFAGFGRHPRFAPADVQRRVVEAGRLGRKTSAGYYDYAADGTRGEPWSELARPPGGLDADAIQRRVLAAIFNEAASALADGVASADDIDTAMQLASNWPSGPISWGERIGLAEVVDTIDELAATRPDGRYEVTPLLRERAAAARSLR
ncbi:MAG TPA: 3-hydroxyacyl-CoA dehydrogenase NAD-binding domain-containing protein [Candidatus Limnocylindria bacterium]|nr:3-hydroxyacyl-CoA dehydrogenase NAD-binding domain-containing protein [Candidatus Limnocylindria bacterium]